MIRDAIVYLLLFTVHIQSPFWVSEMIDDDDKDEGWLFYKVQLLENMRRSAPLSVIYLRLRVGCE